MSKSRSATPTPRLPTNTPPSLEPSTSRLDTNENVPYATQSREPRQSQLASLSTHIQSPPQEYEVQTSRTSARRPAESSPEERSTKRRKQSSKMEGKEAERRSEARSSPSSDSQDELASTEHDTAGHDQNPEAPPTAQVKKKRTRTLTTPHQSAVLHALLAQSRFPTTAMREEVGRAIGLSARKVQIWFQNQRQKARRPRSQSDVPSTQPPQYEPYTNMPLSLSSQHFHPVEGGPPVSGAYVQQDRFRVGSYKHSDTHVQPGMPLLGPGMPGPDVSTGRPVTSGGSESLPRTQSDHSLTIAHRSVIDNPYPNVHDRHPPTPGSSSRMMRPMSARTSGELRQQGFSRTLPPLSTGPPPTPSSHYPSGSTSVLPPLTQSAPSTAIPSEFRRSLSPESVFAFRPHDQAARGGVPIPPPFTLQPPPQWDPTSMAPRPSTSAWSRPTSRSSGENIPPYILQHRTSQPQPTNEEATPRLEPPSPHAPRRSGRYDPIRDNQS